MSLHSSIPPLLQAPNMDTAVILSLAAPAIWNKLPTTVLEVNSPSFFCRRLKSHLFSHFSVVFDTN